MASNGAVELGAGVQGGGDESSGTRREGWVQMQGGIGVDEE